MAFSESGLHHYKFLNGIDSNSAARKFLQDLPLEKIEVWLRKKDDLILVSRI